MKKWLRRSLFVLLAVASVLVLGVLGAWLYLVSGAGSERVRKLALDALGSAIAGKVEAKTLSLKGGHLVLEHVKLYTPEGELVAELERAELDLKLTALAAKDVVVQDAKLEALRLYLKSDERGLNLSRAVAAKVPSASAAKGEPSATVRVDVQQLKLTQGYVSWQEDYALDGISIEGATEVIAGEALKLHGRALARGTLEGETLLPVELSASGDQSKLAVKLKLGAAHADGDFSIDQVAAHVAELFVPPEVAARFATDFPLKVPLTARGEASLKGVDLAVEAGKARANVQASFEGSTVPSFSVLAEDVDLAELLGKGRASQLRIDAKGRLADTRLESLEGALAVDAAWTHVGTLAVNAQARGGALTVERLALDVRGGSVAARGTASSKGLAMSGELNATDLSQLAKVIAEVTGLEPLPLAGKGEVTVTLTGALRRPRLEADGRLAKLQFSGVAATGLAFEGALADVTRPFEAQLRAEAARLVFSEQTFDDVRASLETKGRQLALELSTKGYSALSLTANGTVDKDGQGIALAALGLTYPEAAWKLESPTHVSVADGLEVEPLTLVSADQRLALQAVVKQGRIDALVDAKNLELTRLPHAFVPTQWGLGGKLDAHAVATGRSASPDAEASVTWRNGSVRTLRGLQLNAQVRYREDRAAGTIDGTSNVGAVQGRFDVPVKGLQKSTAEPLTAEVGLEGVVLEALGPLFEVPLPAKGVASLKLSADGTAAKPRVTAHAEAKDAAWVLDEHRTIPVERLVVDVVPADDGTLLGTAKVGAFGAAAEVKVKTPLTLEGLRAKRPDVAALRALPLELEATVQRLQLKALDEANLLKQDFEGAVSVTLTAKGSVDHPDAKGEVTFQKVHNPKVKPIDAKLTFTSERQDTRLTLAASRGAQRLVDLAFTAQAPLELLVDVEKLTGIAFTGGGEVGPFALNEVLEPDRDRPQPRGTVKAKVELSGTAVDPKVTVRGNIEQAGLGKVALGKAGLSYDYEGALSKLSATLFTGTSGRLILDGTVQLDLSQPAVLKGLDWRKAPLEARVISKGLDLGFLSGAIEQVPRLEGQLDANATMSGPLALPKFVGELHWMQGRIAVLGFGEYKEVEVEVDGSDEAFTLKKLFAKSGGGYAALSGVAVKRGDHWQARLTGEAKSFPIVTDDQLKATVSLTLEGEGVYTASLLDVTRLKIPRAVVELPEVKGKDLQDLERPENIVLVRNGVPVSARQRKKLDALEHKEQVQAGPPVLTVRIGVEAEKNIWVKSSDVNIEVGLSEGFHVDLAQSTQLKGEVQIKQGRIDVIGRRFDLDKSSTVKFSGAANRATVNVRATHKNEREDVTVTATVVGQLPQFSIKLDSVPPMSESDIFALIATGRRTLKQGGSAAITNDQVASVLGSFAAAQLKGVLGKKLPLDVLSIETGSNGFRGTRVEGGKYFSDDVYLGLEARYGADRNKGENDVAAKIQWQFVPHWSLEAYGGNAAYGADLMWSREY